MAIVAFGYGQPEGGAIAVSGFGLYEVLPPGSMRARLTGTGALTGDLTGVSDPAGYIYANLTGSGQLSGSITGYEASIIAFFTAHLARLGVSHDAAALIAHEAAALHPGHTLTTIATPHEADALSDDHDGVVSLAHDVEELYL